MAGTYTFLDVDYAVAPRTGWAKKTGAVAYGGAAKAGFPLFLRGDGYLDPSIHPMGGLTTSLLGAGTHLLDLPNGNFEDGLAGWITSTSGNGVVQVDTTNVLTGKNSIKLGVPANGDTAAITSGLIPAGAGIPLYFSTRTCSNGGTPAGFNSVAFFDKTGTYISRVINVGGALALALNSYGEVGGTVIPPAGTSYVEALILANGSGGVIDVDQVRLFKSPLSTEGQFLSVASPLSPMRSVASKLDDNKHILDFGAVGTGGSNPLSSRFATLAAAQAVYPFVTALTQEIDWAALQAAHNWLVANGGAKLNLGETQLYIGADSVTVTGMQYSQIIGAGIDKCKIIGTGASNDMLYYKTASTGAYYNHWEGFTVTSTATRTGGAHIRWMNEKHSMVTRVKTTRHFNGMQFDAFECMCLIDFYIVDPSGAGTGLVIGAQSTTPPTGSNFNMFTALIRGGSDQGAPPPVGNYGIIINDCDAVFAFNLDVGGVIKNDCLVQPSTRNYNNFWNSCYFDATGAGDCFALGGAGVKAEHTFNGCWFASSGKAVAAGQTAPTSDTVGLRFLSIGSYSDIKCVGCVFYNNSGAGVLVETPQADINMTGCSFTSNGNNAVNWGHQLMIYPSSGQSAAMILNALKFNGTVANKWDILTGPYAYGNIATAMTFITGIQQSTYTLYAFKRVTASDDTATTAGIAAAYTVASATTITVQAYKDWIEITGSTTITGINATWPGHTISLHLQSTLTIRNQVQNIHLNGSDANLPAGTVITLKCNHNYQWYEIGRTATAG